MEKPDDNIITIDVAPWLMAILVEQGKSLRVRVDGFEVVEPHEPAQQ